MFKSTNISRNLSLSRDNCAQKSVKQAKTVSYNKKVCQITATQFINPEDLKKIGDYTGTDPIVHEITEAYGGALISRKKGVGSPDSSHKIHSVYDQAHAEAMYPQTFILSRKMYDSEGLRVDNIADAAIIKYIVKKRNKEQKTIRVAKFIK